MELWKSPLLEEFNHREHRDHTSGGRAFSEGHRESLWLALFEAFSLERLLCRLWRQLFYKSQGVLVISFAQAKK
jgi:hypothetical protein